MDGVDIDPNDYYSDSEDWSEEESEDEDDREWREAFYKKENRGTREDIRGQLSTKIPQTWITFEERKITWMEEKDETPYLHDYLKEVGLYSGFWWKSLSQPELSEMCQMFDLLMIFS